MKGHTLFQGDIIMTLVKCVVHEPLDGFFWLFVQLFIEMRAIILRMMWAFKKARLKMEQKTFSLLASLNNFRIARAKACRTINQSKRKSWKN